MSRRSRSVLPLTTTIPPGKSARVTSRLRQAFRPERLTISHHSFPLTALRRFWTWPLMIIGAVLRRVHRGLAKLLRVDLYALHERPEFVEDSYDGDDVREDADGNRYRMVPIPLKRREKLLGPLGRAAARLVNARLRWQEAQLGYLLITEITIGARPAMEGSRPLPVDLFASQTIDSFVSFDTPCAAGHDITIEVVNTNRRECQLKMALIGTSLE